MGHGKETPRQKMIGMMYLVLTALLALNVQREVLDAFAVVDDGLTKTIEIFSDKNDQIYSQFETAAAQNEKKAGKWRDYANEVRKQSDDIYNYIQDLKIEIINKADKEGNLAVNGREINPMKINSKDNSNIPAEIMVGANNNGKGNDLKAAIVSYREYCNKILDNDPNAGGVKATINKSLDTSDPPAEEGKTETWQSIHFEHLPLVGVICIMSGIQTNIRNAETDMFNYLYSMIDAGSFKFNKLEATVIPNSNYIISGNEYNAEVFIAASDTTQKPSIYLGNWEEIKLGDGNVTYKMVGSYDSIREFTTAGRGLYKTRGSGTGIRKWGGLIRLKAPSGGVDILKPFKQEYQVAEPMLVVSPTKMNVFYLGVDNPVEISVPGVPADKIFPTMTNGNIRKEGSGYVVNPARAGANAEIIVVAEIDKSKRNMGTKTFRVRIVPDPVAYVSKIKGAGPINKQELLAQVGIAAVMENFEFDLQFKITEFIVSANIGGFTLEKPVKSNRFSPEQFELIKKAQRGQKLYIENIKAVGPDGTTRQLGSIALTIK